MDEQELLWEAVARAEGIVRCNPPVPARDEELAELRRQARLNRDLLDFEAEGVIAPGYAESPFWPAP